MVTLKRAYRIAGDLTAEFTFDADRARQYQVTWDPYQPRGKLEGAAAKNYDAAMDDFCTRLSAQLGQDLFVIDGRGMPLPLCDAINLAFRNKGAGHA